jgi:hypothetical protein
MTKQVWSAETCLSFYFDLKDLRLQNHSKILMRNKCGNQLPHSKVCSLYVYLQTALSSLFDGGLNVVCRNQEAVLIEQCFNLILNFQPLTMSLEKPALGIALL